MVGWMYHLELVSGKHTVKGERHGEGYRGEIEMETEYRGETEVLTGEPFREKLHDFTCRKSYVLHM